MTTATAASAASATAPNTISRAGAANPAAALEDRLAAVRDATVPSLRFDVAGLPFERWQPLLRQRVRAALGLDAAGAPRSLGDPGAPSAPGAGEGQPQRALLSAHEEPWQQTPDYRWRRVLLETEPGLRVPGFLVMPLAEAVRAAGGRVPATIACQGHAADGMRLSLGLVPPETYERSITQGDRDFALQAVRHGYACLALEMRGFGELRLPRDVEKGSANSCGTLSSLANLVGRTLVGMRVHDVSAAVDYLSGLPEVDAGRIVLTGNSGGGTVTLYAGAVEPRLAALVPSSAFCTFAASIQSVSHCACNYVPGVAALCDMSDLAGLAAPRPQLIVNGREDHIFPIAGVHEAYGRAQAMYAAAGAPERLRLFVGDGGHRYYAAPVWSWLANALGLPCEWGEARYPAAPPTSAS